MVANDSVMLLEERCEGSMFCECTLCMPPFRVCVFLCMREGEGKCILP